MKEINIARTLAAKRREKGITQEVLASHMGVSKASVSKWETGQSYPDITFLPQLAAYFDISIDDLMGYAPQMAKEAILALYQRLAADFTTRPFDAVVAECEALCKKYFACFPLLFYIGALYVNHASVADNAEKTADTFERARLLFERVRMESDDVELAKQGLSMEAICLLSLNRPEDALILLEGTGTSPLSTESLYVSAYQMTGQIKEAQAVLQRGIYQYFVGVIELLGTYLHIYAKDAAAFAEGYRRVCSLVDAFSLDTLHPALLMKLYIIAAQGFMAHGDSRRALDVLWAYVNLVTGDIYPLYLHGDDFFDSIDGWLAEMDVHPPRNEKAILQSIVDAVASSPAFAPLAGNSEFIQITGKLAAWHQEKEG